MKKVLQHQICKKYHQNISVTHLAKMFHVSRTTIYKVLHQYNPNKLSRKQNIYLMKRNVDALIHNGGHLFTGLSTTYEKTKIILSDEKLPPNILIEDIDVVLSLKRGFHYIETHQGKLTLKVIQHINSLVAQNSYEPGYFALAPMKISGVKYQPPKPSYKHAKRILKNVKNSNHSESVKALMIMLLFDRNQFFWNGNKRTGWLTANYYLLQHGQGVLNISLNQKNTWLKLLYQFYETGNMKRLVYWLNENCITCTLPNLKNE